MASAAALKVLLLPSNAALCGGCGARDTFGAGSPLRQVPPNTHPVSCQRPGIRARQQHKCAEQGDERQSFASHGWKSQRGCGVANHSQPKHRRRVQAHASSESSGVRYPFARPRDLVELPLFPLPLVLFPGQVLPLKIFEYRYRIMTHTLLQTDLRFGVVYATAETGTAAAIGCVAEVFKHERHAEDLFTLVSKGQQRFRVVDIVRTKPYLVGRVEWLEDRPAEDTAPGEDPETLSKEVEGLMKDVIRLSNKVSGKQQSKKDKDAEDLRKQAFPTPFSFWVASTFEGAPVEQQALLELVDTAERLKRERTTLRNTLNYLTAATAVKDVFRSSPSKDSPEDPPPEAPPVGGPD